MVKPKKRIPTAKLTVPQLQKLLILWLLLTFSPDDDPVTEARWNADIGPYVTDLPNAHDSFFSFKNNTTSLGDVNDTLLDFVNSQPPIWGGGGSCKFDYKTVAALLAKI